MASPRPHPDSHAMCEASSSFQGAHSPGLGSRLPCHVYTQDLGFRCPCWSVKSHRGRSCHAGRGRPLVPRQRDTAGASRADCRPGWDWSCGPSSSHRLEEASAWWPSGNVWATVSPGCCQALCRATVSEARVQLSSMVLFLPACRMLSPTIWEYSIVDLNPLWRNS